MTTTAETAIQTGVHLEPEPQWNDYSRSHPEATIFHDSRWGKLMREIYHNEIYYLSASREGKVVGALQLVLQSSLFFGRRLCSMPYFDASGVLADDAAATEALLAEARRLMMSLKAKWVELRQYVPLSDQLPARNDKITLRLRLPETPERLWKRLDSKVRNHIRKSRSYELIPEVGGPELVNDFYSVYSRTMRDLGSPPHSLQFFEFLLQLFPGESRLYVMREGKMPLAVSLTMHHRGLVFLPWAGNHHRYRKSNANMLLYWTMLGDSCAQKGLTFDFGRSTRGSGTHRFKAQWGAVEKQLHWQYLKSDGTPPSLGPENPKFNLAQACWKRLPLWLSRSLGPRIISKLP